MLKPASLRAALTAAVPYLQQQPDALHVWISEGNVHATMHGGLSFEYEYQLHALITDYAGHADCLIAPVMAWLRHNQPDMLLNPERMEKGFGFEADILDHEKVDIELTLSGITERVRVVQAEHDYRHAEITHLPEPPVDQYEGVKHWTYFLAGEKKVEWDVLP